MDNKNLEHRIRMIADDLKAIRQFIIDNGLSEAFEKSTRYCDNAHTHLENISVACDLGSNEALGWKKFS